MKHASATEEKSKRQGARTRKNRSSGRVLVEGEGVGCRFGDIEDARREDAEVQRANGGEHERESERRRDCGGHIVGGWFREVHGDDHAQVIIRADHAVNSRDDHEPNERRLANVEGRLEGEELA